MASTSASGKWTSGVEFPDPNVIAFTPAVAAINSEDAQKVLVVYQGFNTTLDEPIVSYCIWSGDNPTRIGASIELPDVKPHHDAYYATTPTLTAFNGSNGPSVMMVWVGPQNAMNYTKGQYLYYAVYENGQWSDATKLAAQATFTPAIVSFGLNNEKVMVVYRGIGATNVLKYYYCIWEAGDWQLIGQNIEVITSGVMKWDIHTPVLCPVNVENSAKLGRNEIFMATGLAADTSVKTFWYSDTTTINSTKAKSGGWSASVPKGVGALGALQTSTPISMAMVPYGLNALFCLASKTSTTLSSQVTAVSASNSLTSLNGTAQGTPALADVGSGVLAAYQSASSKQLMYNVFNGSTWLNPDAKIGSLQTQDVPPALTAINPGATGNQQAFMAYCNTSYKPEFAVWTPGA